MAGEERTLRERLRRGPIDVDDVVGIMDDVLSAVATAHAGGFVDRALAPERVVLHRAGGGRLRARLSEPRARGVAAEPVLDAFQYMAPEQVRGSLGVDRRADVYALGAIAFAALTGRVPFEGANPLVLIAKKLESSPPTLESASGKPFPPLLELFVATAMAPDRDRRYARVEVARAVWREATRRA